jgi:hypothetical protein
MPEPQHDQPHHPKQQPDVSKADDAVLPEDEKSESSDAEEAQEEQDRQLESGEENPVS